MGDFDRVETSSKDNQNKKLAIVLVLGVVLIGLVVFQGTKRGGPLPVGASTVNGTGSSQNPTGIDETPDQVRKALQNDPTRSLLLGGAEPEQNLDRVPRNPFQLSDSWRRSLTRATPVATSIDPVVKPVVPPRVVVPVRIEDYKLNMIAGQTAIINGVVVFPGSLVGKARVLQIRDDGVQLQSVESPDGPATWLKLR